MKLFPRTFALPLLALLAACSSLMPQQASPPRSLDYLNDDLASLVLAFDVPEDIEPIPDTSTLSFTVTIPGQGQRQVDAVLTRGDIGDAAGALPPPADNRTYFLFTFSEPDRAKLREAQAWARGIAATGVQPATPVVSIAPRFCAAEPVDPAKTRISVLLALPGATNTVPLISNQSLAILLAGASLPPCAGHSG